MFERLPVAKRSFLPAQWTVDDVESVITHYQELADRARSLASPASFERWLCDWSELESALSEEEARRHIRMTCYTDDVDAEQAFLRFVDDIAPRCKPLRFALSQHFVEHPLVGELNPLHYGRIRAVLHNQVELFRAANVALEAEEQRLAAEYQKLRADMTVLFDGETLTLEQLEAMEEHANRSRREHAWQVAAKRFADNEDAFDELFDRMLNNRLAQARNAGFSDYRAYRFRKLERFDYGPETCMTLHESVEREVVPFAASLLERRRRALGLERLRPWDLHVDPVLAVPLRPFSHARELVSGCRSIFEAVDPELARSFEELDRLALLDVSSRPGKAPGGYQADLSEIRKPFIFMNAVGRHEDVLTLLHEGGHALHCLAAAKQPLLWNRMPPTEFCEVASMSMELFGAQHLDAFYGTQHAARARHQQLEAIVSFFPQMVVIDAFQHWLYTHPEQALDHDARRSAWTALHARFHPGVDWTGIERERAAWWHRKLHIFELPFYYVEYGMAQIGALQIWHTYRLGDARTRVDTITRYRQALSLGATRGLSDLFASAGARFDVGAAMLRELMDHVRSSLDETDQPDIDA